MASPTSINGTSLAFVNFDSRIGSDAKVLNSPVLDFTLSPQYQIDLTQVSNLSQLKYGIQSIFVDASNCRWSNTAIQIGSQTIVIAPGTQGYYPITVPTGAPIFTISNFAGLAIPYNFNNYAQGASNIRTFGTDSNSLFIQFFNVPFIASSWRVCDQLELSRQAIISIVNGQETYYNNIWETVGIAATMTYATIGLQGNTQASSSGLLVFSIQDLQSVTGGPGYSMGLAYLSIDIPVSPASGYYPPVVSTNKYTCAIGSETNNGVFTNELQIQGSVSNTTSIGVVVTVANFRIDKIFGPVFGYNFSV